MFRILFDAPTNIIDSENDFLFAKPCSDIPVVRYKFLQNHATKSKVENHQAITCTRLRKHVATITLILNMSSSDVEKLAKFMGHTLKVQLGAYQLPDDIYQTAKLSKRLLIMEKAKLLQG